MGGALETFRIRRGELGGADPLNWHPVNQKMAKSIRGQQEKGRNRNAEKAKERKEDIHLQRQNLQFQKALDHTLEGHDDMDTPEALDALSTIGKHEKVIDIYCTRRKTTITITFVDLPRPNGIDKEALGQEEVLNAA